MEKRLEGSGRDPREIKLVAVSKTVEVVRIKEAMKQEFLFLARIMCRRRRRRLRRLARPVAWHFIGHLQSNKAKYAVHLFDMIHSLDSLPLAEELNRRAEQAGRVHEGDDRGKPLWGDDQIWGGRGRVLNLAKRILDLNHLSLEGLMTMPPYFDSPEMSRPYYIGLRELKERMVREGIPMKELSMGMSNDFEIAIEEGATYVRVGTAIFGARK